jgi:hypothetical protein
MTDTQAPKIEFAALAEASGILWEQGPVDPPPPLPPLDPDFAAVVVEVPEVEAPKEEAIPEIPSEDIQEVVEPVVVATVSWVDEDTSGHEAVSLDLLLVTPPPPRAEALAPPLPPPSPSPPPMPHPAAAAAPPVPDPFAASPSFVTGEHRIVLHTVEGQVLRGSIANADLEDSELPLIQPNGAVARVPASTVKAIFFMLPSGEQPPQASGTRVQITFGDGRQISGLAPDYSANSGGFFVLPLDARTNTARVWVYRAAIRQMSFG